MFDNYYQGPTEYIPYEKTVTVTKERAPTDASIKLLNEMQDKVIKNILDRNFTTDNVLKVNWFVHREECWKDVTLICRFTLNGRDFDFNIQLKNHELIKPKPLEVFETIKNKVIEKLSTMIVINGIQADLGRCLAEMNRYTKGN